MLVTVSEQCDQKIMAIREEEKQGTVLGYTWPSPIHSTSLEMSEVSSDAAILLIRVPQQNDTGIVMSAL